MLSHPPQGRETLPCLVPVFLLLLVGLQWSGRVWAQDEPTQATVGVDNETCLACHGDLSAGRFVDPSKFAASIHGPLDCTSCHTEVTAIPHDVPLASVRWQEIPSTCGQCHVDEYEAYRLGIHGQAVEGGRREAPVCTDCHGSHTISPINETTSRVYPSRIPETCAQCHTAERITTKYRLPTHVVATYMESFHGLAVQLGSVTVANCASCHGAHDILPSGDARSSVSPGNLAQTCGKCHAGVSAQVARGQIHSGTQPGLEHRAVSFIRRFYLVLILLVIGGMLLHNLLDFFRKFRAHARRMAAVGAPARMSLNERLQHGLLILAFVGLAYTGFALKSPQAWWASPFVGRVDWRSFAHRAFAVVFCALALYHLAYVLGTAKGRRHLSALLPRRADFIQPFQMLAYYLGRRTERPAFARYSYVEKAEYWALVWGSAVMAATGGLMTWEGWTLKVFPKWCFDAVTAVHYYEAILACLAIVVWHFYFVIFDPDEYPMKWTWISGQPSPADQAHRTETPDADEPPADGKNLV